MKEEVVKLAALLERFVSDLRESPRELKLRARLGHKRIEITLNTYAHALPSHQKDAAARMGALLRGVEYQ